MSPDAPLSRTQELRVVDSHTGGEPTRIVIEGGPDLGGGSMAGQLERLRRDHDWLRSAVVNEPHGSDVVVGALLCEPADRRCAAGVIFFNNVGYLGMCGHGTIGLAVTLAHLGRIAPGEHLFETPVGIVKVMLEDRNTASFENVASYRLAKGLELEVPDIGIVRGDLAWGGNWFFLVEDHGLDLQPANVPALTRYALRVREAMTELRIAGKEGSGNDHVELFGPAVSPEANSRNFVLCPGGAYDRSPCGTGTSAKLACLVADGKLAPGEVWRQESIIGSLFEGSVRVEESDGVVTTFPRIRGRAYVNAESRFILDPQDLFSLGIR